MDPRVLAALALATIVAWPVSARTVRCRDGTLPAAPGQADVPGCDTGTACDGLCTFAVPACPCWSCVCPAVVCIPGSVFQVSVPAGRRLVLDPCRTRGVRRLVLRCSARRCAAAVSR